MPSVILRLFSSYTLPTFYVSDVCLLLSLYREVLHICLSLMVHCNVLSECTFFKFIYFCWEYSVLLFYILFAVFKSFAPIVFFHFFLYADVVSLIVYHFCHFFMFLFYICNIFKCYYRVLTFTRWAKMLYILHHVFPIC